MLWFNFTFGLNFIQLCFKLIIIHYHNQKQRKIKFKPGIKLNHNIHVCTCLVFSQLHHAVYDWPLLSSFDFRTPSRNADFYVIFLRQNPVKNIPAGDRFTSPVIFCKLSPSHRHLKNWYSSFSYKYKVLWWMAKQHGIHVKQRRVRANKLLLIKLT